MRSLVLVPILGFVTFNVLVNAATLLAGGAVIVWDDASEGLEVIRNGSVLIEEGTITAVFSGQYNRTLPTNLSKIDTTNDIVTTGFIDPHRHSWQTAFKTLGSNITLLSYLPRFGTSSPVSTTFTPEDVYVGQLAGLYEALNAGVTTIVDFAHCAWSAEHARAALEAAARSPAALRAWLSNGVRYRNHQGDYVYQSSMTVRHLLDGPYEFLAISVANFLAGMASYLGSAWVRNISLGNVGGNGRRLEDLAIIVYFGVGLIAAGSEFNLWILCKARERRLNGEVLKGLQWQPEMQDEAAQERLRRRVSQRRDVRVRDRRSVVLLFNLATLNEASERQNDLGSCMGDFRTPHTRLPNSATSSAHTQLASTIPNNASSPPKEETAREVTHGVFR